MLTEQKTKIVCEVMDLMAGFENLPNQGKPEQLQIVINTLGSYPKPQKKQALVNCNTKDLGVYLCISTIRNTCKLSIIGYQSFSIGLNVINYNLEKALTLLTE